MPEQTSARSARITGEDILSEILRNLEEGLFKIRHTALVPSIYRVYMHPEELEPLRGALPYLVEEVKHALDDKLAEWNSARKSPGLLDRLAGAVKDETEYKRIGEEWTVEFFPDINGELGKGEIEIHSDFGAAPKPEYGSGSLTRRIIKRSGGELQTVSSVHGDEAPPRDDTTRADAKTAPIEAGPAIARIRYEDDLGPHEYNMSKEQIVIGRGGKAYWVDLKLNTLPDVSREHCRIRRDGVSGAFFIKDVSQFGTSVNGTPVPPSIERVDGQESDKNVEAPLPRRARIGLADTIFLDFEAK
jgi:hypothetical protein